MTRIDRLVRPSIRMLEPYHCARETVQEGLLLDANENPFPRELKGTGVNRYPDPLQRELRGNLSLRLGVDRDQVLAGSGSDEILDWIFKVFCEPGRDRVAVTEPTYGMYRVLARICDVDIFEWPLSDGDFEFDAEGYLRNVGGDVKVLFLCSPNNPTGNSLDAERILRVVQEWDGLVVVDEAYVEFSSRGSLVPQVETSPNLLVLRTFSKAWGRAGLRLGYAVADPEVISCFMKVKAPYNLNALILEEGSSALRDHQDIEAQVQTIVQERESLARRLGEVPAVEQVYPSDANFLLFRCPEASRICSLLLDDGIVVRDRSSLRGLENCIRVTVGAPEENELFMTRLTHHLSGVVA